MREYIFTIALKISMNRSFIPDELGTQPMSKFISTRSDTDKMANVCYTNYTQPLIFLSSAAHLVRLLIKADRQTTLTAAVNWTHISHWLEDAVWHVLPKQTWARQLLSDDLLVTVAHNIKANNQSLARSRGNFPRVLCSLFGQPELTAIIYSHHYKLFFPKWTRVT